MTTDPAAGPARARRDTSAPRHEPPTEPGPSTGLAGLPPPPPAPPPPPPFKTDFADLPDAGGNMWWFGAACVLVVVVVLFGIVGAVRRGPMAIAGFDRPSDAGVGDGSASLLAGGGPDASADAAPQISTAPVDETVPAEPTATVPDVGGDPAVDPGGASSGVPTDPSVAGAPPTTAAAGDPGAVPGSPTAPNATTRTTLAPPPAPPISAAPTTAAPGPTKATLSIAANGAAGTINASITISSTTAASCQLIVGGAVKGSGACGTLSASGITPYPASFEVYVRATNSAGSSDSNKVIVAMSGRVSVVSGRNWTLYRGTSILAGTTGTTMAKGHSAEVLCQRSVTVLVLTTVWNYVRYTDTGAKGWVTSDWDGSGGTDPAVTTTCTGA